MKPFPNRTGTFQRIRLSIARELASSFRENLQLAAERLSSAGDIATVVLRLVNGFTVSPDGHCSTDYYDHSAPHHD
jgi:hypothetical protein